MLKVFLVFDCADCYWLHVMIETTNDISNLIFTENDIFFYFYPGVTKLRSLRCPLLMMTSIFVMV